MTTTHYIVRRKSDGKYCEVSVHSGLLHWSEDCASKFFHIEAAQRTIRRQIFDCDLIEVTVTTTERVVNPATLEG